MPEYLARMSRPWRVIVAPFLAVACSSSPPATAPVPGTAAVVGKATDGPGPSPIPVPRAEGALRLAVTYPAAGGVIDAVIMIDHVGT